MALLGIFGPPNVAALYARQDVQGLIQALNYLKDEQVREQAAQALGQLKSVQAAEPLTAILENVDDYDSLRVMAATALGDIGEPSASDSLLRAITRSTTPVALAAAAALQRIDPDGVVCAVNDAITLRRLFERIPDRTNVLYRPVMTLLRSLGPPAVESLASMLQDPDLTWDRKTMVAETLASMGEIAIEPLVQVYKSRDAMGGRQLAIEALGRIGGDRVREILVAALQDREITIRWRAAGALRALHWQPSSLPERVLWGIATEDWRAALALDNTGLEPLFRELENRSSHDRATIARALGEIGDERAVAPLASALETANEGLASTLLSSLAKFGEKAVTPLVRYIEKGGAFSKEALSSLEELVQANVEILPQDELIALADLECCMIKELQWSTGEPDGGDKKSVEYRQVVDCSAVRHLARKEMTRRSQY